MTTLMPQLHDWFCENVRTLRVGRGWTQTALGGKLDVSQSRVAEIEGGRFAPRIDLVERVAKVFRVPPKNLLENPKNLLNGA